MSRLLRRSGGRPGNLSLKERAELRRLARKLDLQGIGSELMALGRGRRRRERRRARRGERRR